MKPNTCLVVDVWEGQLEIDEAALKAGGVAGMSIRINDMSGGHHADTGFQKQWDEAKNFVRFPYFVYNPWVDGAANFAWLREHMPAEAKSVAIDVEVKYPGYPANKYAGELVKFLNLCKPLWRTIVYTAEWFLSDLSSWPRVDYWWAQYPAGASYFAGVTTWGELKVRLDRIDRPFNVVHVPGTLKLWQFSGDYLTLPGTTRKIDVNLFYGSEQELADYFGGSTAAPVPVLPAPSMGWLKGRHVDSGPAIIAASDTPLKATHPTIALGDTQQAWIRSLNLYDDAVYRLFTAADVGPTKGINSNGKMIYIPAGWSGNVVKVLDRQNGWVKVDSINLSNSLPNNANVNHRLTPWLVHRMTTVSASGNFVTFPARADGKRSAWDMLDDPLFSVNGEFWIPSEWVQDVATLNRNVNMRSGPATSYPVLGTMPGGTKITVTTVSPDSQGNIWGLIGAGRWCCLRYYGVMYSDWVLK